MHRMLQELWYSKKLPYYAYILLPLTWIYQFILMVRKFFYYTGWIKSYTLKVPVIVIGNKTVGGTGKTPVVVALAHFFKSKGFRVGLVSRGYRKSSVNSQVLTEVYPHMPWKLVGDEALLLVEKTHCPMIIGKDRVLAAKRLISKFHCNLILSDDGLQYYRLIPKLNLCLVDSHLGFGNGYCLPLGPLREGVKGGKKIDYLLFNKHAVSSMNSQKISSNDNKVLKKIGLYQKSCYLFNYQFCYLKQITSGQQYDPSILSAFIDSKVYVYVLAAIAKPDHFLKSVKGMLDSLNLLPKVTIKTRFFRDHHPLSYDDIAVEEACAFVIMTEKDAVKCKDFCDERYFCLGIKAVLPESLLAALHNQICHSSS